MSRLSFCHADTKLARADFGLLLQQKTDHGLAAQTFSKFLIDGIEVG
jgi:hypothetical protein